MDIMDNTGDQYSKAYWIITIMLSIVFSGA